MKTTQRSRFDRYQLSIALADRLSRHLLSCVQDGPATVRDLAIAIAAADRDCVRSAVTTADRVQYQRQLDHSYLPQLTGAGLLTQSSNGLVWRVPTVLDHFDVSFPSLADPDDPAWPAAAAVVGRAYRYPLVSAVAERESVSLSELADRLASTDAAADETPRELAIALHHVDLPKLTAVDLLRYDPAARTVAGTPAIEALL